jgi:hypothetical protein
MTIGVGGASLWDWLAGLFIGHWRLVFTLVLGGFVSSFGSLNIFGPWNYQTCTHIKGKGAGGGVEQS